MTKATWLADVLRRAGLAVVEIEGWQDRGRPGSFGPVKGVLCHHTSGSRHGNAPSLDVIKNGRPDLHGPLSHLLLGRDGTFYVVAAGRCNHAGRGRWQGITEGNRYFIGIEAENDGRGETWPGVQIEAYAHGVAAILKFIGADSVMAAGHKEYALPAGRKVDPTFDMFDFRQHVQSIMGLGGTPTMVHQTDSTHGMLEKGDQGPSVRQLQRALGIVADGAFGPKTDAAVREFQRSKGLTVDGKVGPQTWAALGVN